MKKKDPLKSREHQLLIGHYAIKVLKKIFYKTLPRHVTPMLSCDILS